jgi:uncharacterized protein YfiM (DUF2279 family)
MAAQGWRDACTVTSRLGGRRGVWGRVARAGWGRKAVAWRFPGAQTNVPRTGLGVWTQRTVARRRRRRR